MIPVVTEDVKFYTYLKLQGSQTAVCLNNRFQKFYTYLKLQGSQTKRL